LLLKGDGGKEEKKGKGRNKDRKERRRIGEGTKGERGQTGRRPPNSYLWLRH